MWTCSHNALLTNQDFHGDKTRCKKESVCSMFVCQYEQLRASFLSNFPYCLFIFFLFCFDKIKTYKEKRPFLVVFVISEQIETINKQ